MQGLVQAMQRQAHTQAALQAQLEAQAQVPAQDHGGPSIMERFKRMLPPSFKGESDLLLAESWMREIEKIFRAIRCADEDKVTLATYMLQERADVWWDSLLRTRFEDGAVDVAWDEFEGEMEQYLEEKKASQKRPATTFLRQDKKKAVYQTQQRSVAVGIMASRGRRGEAPAREDEPRREERAEQQAPTPKGPAHTQAALQAQLEAQAQVPAQDHGGTSIMERFKRMLPPSFKGESDPLLAESWMREIEKILRAIRCADEDKVTLATYMLQKEYLTESSSKSREKCVEKLVPDVLEEL
ncbi:hypothetical protein Taro_035732 [Colocasia esculenta]|uniref:Uncharacterized protein n=1 Tax=Colocasia esculenta TaxID=4460 RepID=A0A843W7J0_COLES|nr:hypothetical protein [Colocasia esculenta]